MCALKWRYLRCARHRDCAIGCLGPNGERQAAFGGTLNVRLLISILGMSCVDTE